ncbi:hypothetical protein PLANPX_4372 [Lacipirellula parvula]|uniref:Uncharacterized protein n=1 Tax=Lacipirellula parvula TaxID=2650471 RepID=A0A5K7XD75_9BACT|nr:hypothetical protein PLANPX_4372 [Lacipirellula parvula]
MRRLTVKAAGRPNLTGPRGLERSFGGSVHLPLTDLSQSKCL